MPTELETKGLFFVIFVHRLINTVDSKAIVIITSHSSKMGFWSSFFDMFGKMSSTSHQKKGQHRSDWS